MFLLGSIPGGHSAAAESTERASVSLLQELMLSETIEMFVSGRFYAGNLVHSKDTSDPRVCVNECVHSVL